MQARAAQLAGRQRDHQPSTEHPFVVLLVDEVAFLTAYRPGKRLRERALAAIATLTTQGRGGLRRRGCAAGPAQGRADDPQPVPGSDRDAAGWARAGTAATAAASSTRSPISSPSSPGRRRHRRRAVAAAHPDHHRDRDRLRRPSCGRRVRLDENPAAPDPCEFIRHHSPFRVSAPHHTGAWNRKCPKAGSDKARTTAHPRPHEVHRHGDRYGQIPPVTS